MMVRLCVEQEATWEKTLKSESNAAANTLLCDAFKIDGVVDLAEYATQQVITKDAM